MFLSVRFLWICAVGSVLRATMCLTGYTHALTDCRYAPVQVALELVAEKRFAASGQPDHDDDELILFWPPFWRQAGQLAGGSLTAIMVNLVFIIRKVQVEVFEVDRTTELQAVSSELQAVRSALAIVDATRAPLLPGRGTLLLAKGIASPEFPHVTLRVFTQS
jgi:hypothetical protein